MVSFGHRRGGGGGPTPQNPEITFFKVKFSNSRGGPDPRSPPLDPRMCFCDCTGRFESYLVGNPEDQFSRAQNLSHSQQNNLDIAKKEMWVFVTFSAKVTCCVHKDKLETKLNLS